MIGWPISYNSCLTATVAQRGSAMCSSPAQDNYLCNPLIIVLSMVFISCTLVVVLKPFTLDIGEIANVGRCHNKKSTALYARSCLTIVNNIHFYTRCNTRHSDILRNFAFRLQ